MQEKIRPGYKQTEVGVIPEDWEVKPLPQAMEFIGGKAHERHIQPYGKFSVVNSKFISSEGRVVKYTNINFCPARRGDILMVMSDLPNGKALAKCFLVEESDRFAVNQRVCILRPRNSDSRFFYYQLNRNPYFLAFDDGVQQTHLLNGVFRACRVIVPPSVAEQTAIAEALSDADARIAALEALIAKKRDLKQAAMQQLLTGKTRLPGFSGDWGLKRLGELGTCIRGVSYKGDSDLSPHETGSTVRLLRSNNVQSARIVFADFQFVDRSCVSDLQMIQDGDLLVCASNGSKALVGKAAVFVADRTVKYTFGAFMVVFRPSSTDADSRFVGWLFQSDSYREQLGFILAGSSINNLTPTSLKALSFPIPVDLAEQSAIAEILSDMDAELAALEAEGEKARSIKQGMMQNLLTGKVRLA